MIRNDFLYWIVLQLQFRHLNAFDNFSDAYVQALVDYFNKASYKEVFKWNNNLTVKEVRFSINCFFEHINRNHYDYKLKKGILTWKIDKNIEISYCDGKDYKKLFDKEYLSEWQKNGYYWLTS